MRCPICLSEGRGGQGGPRVDRWIVCPLFGVVVVLGEAVFF